MTPQYPLFHRPNGDKDKLEEELQAVRCSAFTHYAEECSNNGVVVEWRTAKLCRKLTYRFMTNLSFVYARFSIDFQMHC